MGKVPQVKHERFRIAWLSGATDTNASADKTECRCFSVPFAPMQMTAQCAGQEKIRLSGLQSSEWKLLKEELCISEREKERPLVAYAVTPE